METVFLRLLNLSITASWLVLVVLLLRLGLKKAPRWMFCLLWGLVGLRLLLPVLPESVFSLVPNVQVVPETIIRGQTPVIGGGELGVGDALIAESLVPVAGASANTTQLTMSVLTDIWFVGAVSMLLYLLISYLKLRRQVATATKLEGNIWQSENVASPFILGVFRPGIYLPYDISEENFRNVIAHERAHIRRGDHFIKPAAFLLLAVYWFNPLIWLAYALLCRDIELACDERVIRTMDEDERRSYSGSLLSCNTSRRIIAACPLAFGEIGVKERVIHVKLYKKPAFKIVVIALVVCAVAALCFLTNPKNGGAKSPYQWTSSVSAEDIELGTYPVNEEASHMPKLTDAQLTELVGILNAVEPDSIYTGSGASSDMPVSLYCDGLEYTLDYENDVVNLGFNEEAAKLYGEGVWEIHDEALNQFMKQLRVERSMTSYYVKQPSDIEGKEVYVIYPAEPYTPED